MPPNTGFIARLRWRDSASQSNLTVCNGLIKPRKKNWNSTVLTPSAFHTGTPGDIRVGFEYKKCPRAMTVVGVQNDDMIMPVRRVSGTYALAAPGNITAEELINTLDSQEANELFTLRFVCGMGVFLGMFVMIGNFVPFRVVFVS